MIKQLKNIFKVRIKEDIGMKVYRDLEYRR